MRKRHWIMSAGTGMALLLTSCTANRTKTQSAPPAPQAFTQPVIPEQNLTLPPVKITGMIQPSNGKVPLMPVTVSSNRDPFSSVEMPGDLKATIKPAPTIATKSTPAASVKNISAKNIGAQPVVSLPQPRPIRLSPTPMSPMTLSAAPTQPAVMPPPPKPPASRTNLAEAIGFTGVVQTGSKLSAIVQDTDGTSRYVQTGESLAGGEVTVKRIDLNPSGIPSIVFLQNGIEFIKSVGSEGSTPL